MESESLMSNPVFNRIMWLLSMIAAPLILYVCYYVFYWLKNYSAQQTIIEEQKKANKTRSDSRLPILYLRNFAVDGSTTEEVEKTVPNMKFKLNLPTLSAQEIDLNIENYIRDEVSFLGPMISIGEFNPRDIGINRVRTNDEDWKSMIGTYMFYSRMIILRTSSACTPGIEWELTSILEMYLHKTLFFVEDKGSELNKELDDRLTLRFPNTNQISYKTPYYFSVSREGKRDYSASIPSSTLFTKLLKDSAIDQRVAAF